MDLKFAPDQVEPEKIKFYISVNTELNAVEDFDEVEADLDNKIKNIVTAMQLN
jgi:hypothetical protein